MNDTQRLDALGFDGVEIIHDEAEPTRWYMLLDDAQAMDLASGYVPTAVQAMARAMLDWRDEDRRRAQRPAKASRGARLRR